MKERKHNNPPKKRIFISHASKDYKATHLYSNLYKPLTKKYIVVCSTEKGLNGFLHDEINKEISECDVFFALITENYVRSPHCLYELAVARFVNPPKKIVIYINNSVKERVKDIAFSDLASIDLKADSNLETIINSIISQLGIVDLPKEKDKIKDFLERALHQNQSYQPYVGMSENVYNNLLRYCEQESIIKFGDGSVYTQSEMIDRCKNAKKIYVVSTTGAGLLKTLKEDALKKALWNKAEINIIIPDRGSLFCKDVAEAECCRDGYNTVIENQNKRRIESEFEATVQYLNETYCLAQKRHKSIGSITVFSCRTLLRQTLFLTVSQENCSWGWINMTMPPLRTSETPSIAISDTNVKKGLDKYIISHCECLIKMARKYKAFLKIDGKTIASPLESIKKDDQEKYWIDKRETAKRFMQKRIKLNKILIEVAAQHPLNLGEFPNEEFQKRLDVAIQLCKENGEEKVWFYVPGSRHKYNGAEDKISLSEAGKNYLVEHGIDENHIYADDTNIKYKGEQGVYNSADESYVASCIFKDDDFGRMICVCSPYQTMRKSFYYLEFGLIPECHGVPCKNMFHDPISEYFGSLHHTVLEDHNWQDEDSEAARKSRIDRKT